MKLLHSLLPLLTYRPVAALLATAFVVVIAGASHAASAQSRQPARSGNALHQPLPTPTPKLLDAKSPEVRNAIAQILSARRESGVSASYTARLRTATLQVTDALGVLGTVDDRASLERARAKFDASLAELGAAYEQLLRVRGASASPATDPGEPLARFARAREKIVAAPTRGERKAAALALRDQLQAHDLPKNAPAPVTQRYAGDQQTLEKRRTAAQLAK